jgi:hypothetical protein
LRILREYLKENQQKNWIRNSKLLINIPILFIPKANGILRLYVDYRTLNKITIKNRYLLSLINEIIDRLADIMIYTKLNLKNVYYKIRIKSENDWKTAFRTRYNFFKYIIMLFGFINAPIIFQIYINEIFKDFLNIIYVIYIDDICIYSSKFEKYTNYVRQIFDRLRKFGLYINLDKCEFSITKIIFLNYIIKINNVEMNQTKIKTINK